MDEREQRPVTALRGVGDALAKALARLGIAQVQDLLFLLPQRYEDRTRIVPLGELVPGASAVVEGEIQLAEVAFRRRRQLLVRLSDGSGFITLRFFHFSAPQQQALARGIRLRCFGEIRRGPLGLEIVHPEYRRVALAETADDQSLTPVYPATEGITQGRLRQLVNLALAELRPPAAVRDWLPPQALSGLAAAGVTPPSLREALEFVHHPDVDADQKLLFEGLHPAQRRLAFEELLAHQLSLRLRKLRAGNESALPLTDAMGLTARLIQSLPFKLTGAQARACAEVDQDLAAGRPMLRLVQGDVGSGKTVVAAAAAARAAGTGAQVALMAPTELLAEQHWRNFNGWFQALGLPVALLTGSQPVRTRRSAQAAIASGEIQLAIGTHALFQDGVSFNNLALIIVDEQHRFGVQQRLTLQEKGQATGQVPHQLIMTATPIPRTLAMTAYADLDISVIDELPPGRTPVTTVVLGEQRRHEVVARIHQACREGRQAYWVCPLIEESEELEYQAAEETRDQLAEALPHLKVGLVHGRQSSAEKAAVMADFKANRIQLLVATTVIEVGVDVPNATVMVIENAERMGLAQLHQLRGRVGRGAAAAMCVLLYRAPLSQLARSRLNVIRETNDGFEIARRDLELRGPGEMLGTRQTGLAQLRVADLLRDQDLLPEVQRAAALILAQYPDSIAPLTTRWIGAGERYGRVG